MADGPDEHGAWVTDTQWDEVCAKAKFRCKECKERPDVEDIDIFLDEDLCGSCFRRWQRIYESD